MTRARGLLCLLVLLLSGAPARASFEELGVDLGDRVDRMVRWEGALRIRSNLFWNLDLDRGPTPSGEPLFPVPLEPSGQLLTQTDMRLRTDLTFIAPNGGLAVHLRLDLLDGVSLGSRPDGPPSAATGQSPDAALLTIRRAWAEALTPLGVLAAGRMGSHWGLGLLTHGGDDPDSDGGDAADRVAFSMPLFGLVFALAYDFTATGPDTPRRGGTRSVDLDPSDDVSTLTFAVLRYHDARAHRRRLRAGKATLDLGAYLSHRSQDNDVPAEYTPSADRPELSASQLVHRGFAATAVDVWARLSAPGLLIELEAAYLTASYDQASLIPGVELAHEVGARQWGFAIQTRFGEVEPPRPKPHPLHADPPADPGGFTFGLDLGAASGDPAFGFGVEQPLLSAAPQRGDLDGSQLRLPYDTRFSNFRFHPDFRVDQILFRELIGTVTDAFYVRPHLRHTFAPFLSGRLSLELALIASWALEPTSTPGQRSPLGIEVDPTLSYVSDDGLRIDIDYAVLFPFSGLDGLVDPATPELAALTAKPAQLWRFRVGYHF